MAVSTKVLEKIKAFILKKSLDSTEYLSSREAEEWFKVRLINKGLSKEQVVEVAKYVIQYYQNDSSKTLDSSKLINIEMQKIANQGTAYFDSLSWKLWDFKLLGSLKENWAWYAGGAFGVWGGYKILKLRRNKVVYKQRGVKRYGR